MDFAELKRMKQMLDRLLEQEDASESTKPPLTQNDPKPTDSASSLLTPESYEESPTSLTKTPSGSEETSEEAPEIPVFEHSEPTPEQKKKKKLRSQKQVEAFEKCRALRWKARKKEKELFDRWSEPEPEPEPEPESDRERRAYDDYYLPTDTLTIKPPPKLMRGIG